MGLRGGKGGLNLTHEPRRANHGPLGAEVLEVPVRAPVPGRRLLLGGAGGQQDEALDALGSAVVDERLHGRERVLHRRTDDVERPDGLLLGFGGGERQLPRRLVQPVEAHRGVRPGFAGARGDEEGASFALQGFSDARACLAEAAGDEDGHDVSRARLWI